VTEQFTNWRKAKEKFLSHQTKKYHKLAVFSSENQKVSILAINCLSFR